MIRSKPCVTPLLFAINQSRVNLALSVVFNHCENPAYLNYWLNTELRIPARVRVMCRIADWHLYDRAFPGCIMGSKAVLVEFESITGFDFMITHMATIQTSVAFTTNIRNDNNNNL
ncbi:hypothetical protein GCK72_024125 [Caenorhabditis remanei]|uniref:Uncharacterized protein n=1 Tax=Caenorhabditis remanei TaxID=31234 RepID=A0A6A5FZ88_CAERE|nr:hypothetical protein GCK72_024125 [Caenorhabditis remanei]KAF1747659.1 hypothetical protein GCK72_024125 [Caenorhabditis remanei]